MSSYLDFIKLQSYVYSESVVSEPFVSFNSSSPLEEFDRTQRIAERNKGIVMSLLNESYVCIVNVDPHDFNSDRKGKKTPSSSHQFVLKAHGSHRQKKLFHSAFRKNECLHHHHPPKRFPAFYWLHRIENNHTFFIAFLQFMTLSRPAWSRTFQH